MTVVHATLPGPSLRSVGFIPSPGEKQKVEKLGLKPEDAVDNLVKIVGGVDAEIIFVTCIVRNGDVSERECFASRTQCKSTMPIDQLFYLPEQTGTTAVRLTSSSSGPIKELHDCDVEFTRRVVVEGRKRGIAVWDHILVEGDQFRALRQCTDLWST